MLSGFSVSMTGDEAVFGGAQPVLCACKHRGMVRKKFQRHSLRCGTMPGVLELCACLSPKRLRGRPMRDLQDLLEFFGSPDEIAAVDEAKFTRKLTEVLASAHPAKH